jgi:predicted RNA-binding Zn-ribbon protein involved in translation (DUF1610 family)
LQVNTGAVETPSQIRCPNCGAENMPGSMFCESCGIQIGQKAVPVPLSHPPAARNILLRNQPEKIRGLEAFTIFLLGWRTGGFPVVKDSDKSKAMKILWTGIGMTISGLF